MDKNTTFTFNTKMLDYKNRLITKAAGDTSAPGCRLKLVTVVICHFSIHCQLSTVNYQLSIA